MGIKNNLDKIIEEKLYDEIIAGEWNPGEQIPLEPIMERYEVSRTPVIQALKKMNAVGVVKYNSAGHYSVPEYTKSDIEDIIDVRKLFEIHAVEEIRDKRRRVDFKKLEKLSKDGIRFNDAGKTVLARRADLQFHRVLVAQAENPVLLELFIALQRNFMVANYCIGRHTVPQQKIAGSDHQQIVEYLRSEEYDKAIEVIVRHLDGALEKIEKRLPEARASKKKS